MIGSVRGADLIVAGLEGIDDVRATVDDSDQLVFSAVCRASASSSSTTARPTPTAPLRDGEPSIFMIGWDSGMFVDPMTLQPDDAEQVVRRLCEVLST